MVTVQLADIFLLRCGPGIGNIIFSDTLLDAGICINLIEIIIIVTQNFLSNFISLQAVVTSMPGGFLGTKFERVSSATAFSVNRGIVSS